MPKPKILLVQGRQIQGNGTKHSLERTGYEIVWAGNGASAMTAAARDTVDVIVIDAALPDIEGGDLCRLFRRRHATSDVPIILLTDRDNAPLSPATAADGPDDYVTKPYADSELGVRIAAALKTRKLRKELVEKSLLLEETRMKAESSAIIDPATGLYNRAQFEAMFSKEFKRAVRYKQPVSCMRIVLDGREDGQKAEEGLVKAIITLIQKTIREVDTAAWWTGEGFIVMIPNTPRDKALQAAARILFAVAEHPFTWTDSNKVALIIGVAGLPDPKIDTEEKLVKAAEEALRQARHFLQLPPVYIPRKRSGAQKSTEEPVKSGSG